MADVDEAPAENDALLQELQRKARLVSAAQDRPVVVANVQVHGLRGVKGDVFEPHVRSLIKAKTLREVLESLAAVGERMERLDVFSQFEAEIDAPEDDEKLPLNSINVILHVKEKGRVRAEAGTYAGTEQHSVKASLGLRNLFGRAERVDAQADWVSSARPLFSLHFVKPVNADPDRLAELILFQQQHDWTATSGCQESVLGAHLKYQTSSSLGQHQFMYELAWRELSKLPRFASMAVREEAGHTVKSSIKHVLLHHRSDSMSMPTRGYSFKLQNELAGLGGDVNFLKNEAEVKYSVPLGWGISIGSCLKGGVMVPLADSPTRLNDRFFLGGPTCVRGFRTRALGPQVARYMDHKPPKGHPTDALGGELFWAGGLSVLTPIPLPSLWSQPFLRAHMFCNAGNLSRLQPDMSWRDGFVGLARNTDVSVGAGLVLQLQGIRVEVNYCLPMSGEHANRKDHGAQVGFGVSFL